MSLLDDIREKATNAAKSAYNATNEFIEVSKINLAISAENDKIKTVMLEIGKVVYDTYSDGRPLEAALSVKCDEISASEKNIDELKLKILDIKNLKKCSGCAAEIDRNDYYCSKCGSRVE